MTWSTTTPARCAPPERLLALLRPWRGRCGPKKFTKGFLKGFARHCLRACASSDARRLRPLSEPPIRVRSGRQDANSVPGLASEQGGAGRRGRDRVRRCALGDVDVRGQANRSGPPSRGSPPGIAPGSGAPRSRSCPGPDIAYPGDPCSGEARSSTSACGLPSAESARSRRACSTAADRRTRSKGARSSAARHAA